MGWINSLYDTYESNSIAIGKVGLDETVLLPISHSTQNAQIEVTIDDKGKFLRANKIDKENSVTIIPVTEDSGTRGNGIFPHPLCDKLCYVAGDYSKYVKGKNMDEYFNKYMVQLKEWCSSLYSHEKTKAVLQYLEKNTMIKDLVTENVLELDADGMLSDKNNKIQGINQSESFVRFIVQKTNDNKNIDEVWLDKTLYDKYIKYYENVNSDKSLCYVTGKNFKLTEKHPSKIRNSGDKSKIISANDDTGFTYRGRFTDKVQAVGVGYEVSHKAHNALRWLIQKQGYTKDGAAIVAWAVNGAEIPPLLESTDDLFREEIEEDIDTAQSYANRLNKAISGYKADLNTMTKVIVIALEAATIGRLSITYYRELNGSEFLDKINNWHMHCVWKHSNYKDGKTNSFVGAPSPREIALAAFGNEQNGILTANNKLLRSTVERLLPCIIDGKRIPFDIINAAIFNACRPHAMSYNNWQWVLSTTCALIRKHRYEKNKEEWDMALDLENNDRSYLFGRLLAVADRIEFLTYERGEKRETNAKRYLNIFSKRPAKTWETIYKNLLPYINKLLPGQKVKYDGMISEIAAMITIEEFNNEALSELFLLGYYCQLDFMKGKNDKVMINEMEEKEDE